MTTATPPRFCTACGAPTSAGVRFCIGCGQLVPQAASTVVLPNAAPAAAILPEALAEPVREQPEPAKFTAPAAPPVEVPPTDAPVPPVAAVFTEQTEYDGSPASMPTKLPGWALPAAGGFVVAAALLWVSLQPGKTDAVATLTGSPPFTAPPAPDTPLEDRYLSEEQAMFVIANAVLRAAPSVATAELGRIEPGTAINGRWVEGSDEGSRWFKTSSGYIEATSVEEEEVITPAGMLGMVADMPLTSIRSRIDPAGSYGSQDPSWNSQQCEQYRSTDGRTTLLVLKGMTSAFSAESPTLHTREGIHLGSTEQDLQAAYGNRLTTEPNPYEGVVYMLWTSPERGIKFHVTSGRVDGITSGNKAINLVEGCL